MPSVERGPRGVRITFTAEEIAATRNQPPGAWLRAFVDSELEREFDMTTPDTPGPADPAGPQQDEGPVQQAQTIPVQEFARGTVSGDYAGRLAYAGERPVNSLAKTIDAPTLAQELRDRIASDKARTAKMEAALNALETNPVIEVALTGLALLRGDRY